MRKISKRAAILLALHMLMLSGLYQSVWAAMISTESIINVNRGDSPCDDLNNILAREEIQAALISQGIDPQEARERIDNLAEDEINRFVHQIDQLPAGGSDFGVIVSALIVLLALIADLLSRDNEN
jgi:hypothetical protein